MISAIALYGIAWLTSTFIAAHEEFILKSIGTWVGSWPFIFALALMVVVAIVAAVTR